jgi:hypothetical protein
MRISSITTIMATLAATMLFVSGANAQGGHTADQLDRAGYTCFNDGPSNFKHCWIQSKIGNPVIPVKVFSEDGMTFLGTEQLLRDDIYAGQPCPQDEIDLWDFIDFGGGLGYFACHHFYTGHH